MNIAWRPLALLALAILATRLQGADPQLSEAEAARKKGGFVLGARGAWGWATEMERKSGATVSAAGGGLKAGFEKDWFGVSLGAHYTSRRVEYDLGYYILDSNGNPVYLGSAGKYAMDFVHLDVPLLAELYIPAGSLLRPGLRVGPAYSLWTSSGYGASSTSDEISVVLEPVLKFLVGSQVDVGLNFRYQYFLPILTYSSRMNLADRALMSLGLEVGFKI